MHCIPSYIIFIILSLRIPLLLMYLFVIVSFSLLLRKFYNVVKYCCKRRKCNPVADDSIPSQLSVQNNIVLNNVQFNPDMIKHTTLIVTFFLFCTFMSPLIYLTYFKNSNNSQSAFDLLDEFYLFLMDLSFHVGISILLPLCAIITNCNLRKFTIQSIKDYF